MGAAAGGFEDGDASVLIDGVDENFVGLGWWEVVEGRKHGAEAVEVGRDFGCGDGSGVEGDFAVGFGLGLGEGFLVGVFVG